MGNIKFKTDIAVNVITHAFDDFLRDKRLYLTVQQYKRLKKLLMIRLLEDEMSYSNAYNQLSEIIEYRKDYEINANAPDEAEEEMIRIIGAADVKEIEITVEGSKFKKRFIAVSSLLALILIGFLGFMTAQYFEHKKIHSLEMARIITSSEEITLKNLVQHIITLERSRNIHISHGAIYNKIKNLAAIKNKGYATSYKKFNYAQFAEARLFLNQWIKDIREETANTNPLNNYSPAK